MRPASPPSCHNLVAFSDHILNTHHEIREGSTEHGQPLLELLAVLVGIHRRVVDKVGGNQLIQRIKVSLVPTLLDDLLCLSLVFFSRHGMVSFTRFLLR